MKIKICGIKDPEMAYFAAKAGADFIGIVRHPGSSRYVERSLATEIAQAAIDGGAIPVAVYVEIYEDIGIEMVQFQKSSIDLPNKYKKILVNGRGKADFLLFDHPLQGGGIPFDWNSFTPPEEFWFLAGGLSAKNVEEAIKKLKPNGVDISSGVEINGRKDKALICEFIEKVRSM